MRSVYFKYLNMHEALTCQKSTFHNNILTFRHFLLNLKHSIDDRSLTKLMLIHTWEQHFVSMRYCDYNAFISARLSLRRKTACWHSLFEDQIIVLPAPN